MTRKQLLGGLKSGMLVLGLFGPLQAGEILVDTYRQNTKSGQSASLVYTADNNGRGLYQITYMDASPESGNVVFQEGKDFHIWCAQHAALPCKIQIRNSDWLDFNSPESLKSLQLLSKVSGSEKIPDNSSSLTPDSLAEKWSHISKTIASAGFDSSANPTAASSPVPASPSPKKSHSNDPIYVYDSVDFTFNTAPVKSLTPVLPEDDHLKGRNAFGFSGFYHRPLVSGKGFSLKAAFGLDYTGNVKRKKQLSFVSVTQNGVTQSDEITRFGPTIRLFEPARFEASKRFNAAEFYGGVGAVIGSNQANFRTVEKINGRPGITLTTEPGKPLWSGFAASYFAGAKVLLNPGSYDTDSVIYYLIAEYEKVRAGEPFKKLKFGFGVDFNRR